MQQQAIVRNTPSGTNDSDLANILCKLIPALQPSSASVSQSNASIKMWRIMLAQSPTGSIATDQPTFFAPQPSHLFIDSIIKATNGKAASLPIATARLQASWMNALYNSPNVDITAACSEDPLLCTSTVVRLANFHFLSESYSTASTDYKHWLSLLSFAPVKTTTTKYKSQMETQQYNCESVMTGNTKPKATTLDTLGEVDTYTEIQSTITNAQTLFEMFTPQVEGHTSIIHTMFSFMRNLLKNQPLWRWCNARNKTEHKRRAHHILDMLQGAFSKLCQVGNGPAIYAIQNDEIPSEYFQQFFSVIGNLASELELLTRSDINYRSKPLTLEAPTLPNRQPPLATAAGGKRAAEESKPGPVKKTKPEIDLSYLSYEDRQAMRDTGCLIWTTTESQARRKAARAFPLPAICRLHLTQKSICYCGMDGKSGKDGATCKKGKHVSKQELSSTELQQLKTWIAAHSEALRMVE